MGADVFSEARCDYAAQCPHRGTSGMIGKIQRVKLREVWKREAADFTTWLMDNIDVLSNLRPYLKKLARN